MAYNTDYLSPIKYIGGAGGNTLWLLMAQDALAAVVGTDYITDATSNHKMTVGDPVIVVGMTTLPATTPTGAKMMYVNAIDADGNATLDDVVLA